MKASKRLSLFSNLMMGYAILAGTWWSVLLFRKNEVVYEVKKELLAVKYHLSETLVLDPAYQLELATIEQEHHRQRMMIIGEGGVLLVMLILGLWWVHRLARKEASVIRQQRNFLLSITHELKSPITSMRLIMETFKKRELQRDQTIRLADNALYENDRLYGLVENLLLAARLEGHYQPIREHINFSEWLTSQVDRFQQQYRQIEIETAIGPDIEFNADPGAILSIFLNLMENAVKYSTKTGTKIRVSLSREGHKIYWSIADQGIGITDKEKRRVFDKFYRTGNEEVRQSTGTGLGLFIVKSLTENHGGKVSVADNHPQGTVFTIEF